MLVREVAHRDLVDTGIELRDQPSVGIRERDREAGADRAVEMDGLRRGGRRTRDEDEGRTGGDE